MKLSKLFGRSRKWIRSGKQLPKESGSYLVCFADEDDPDATCCIVDYYRKGQIMFYRRSQVEGSPEEKILDLITNDELAVHADQDGFYSRCDEKAWLVKPEFWMKLPQPPEGFTWFRSDP